LSRTRCFLYSTSVQVSAPLSLSRYANAFYTKVDAHANSNTCISCTGTRTCPIKTLAFYMHAGMQKQIFSVYFCLFLPLCISLFLSLSFLTLIYKQDKEALHAKIKSTCTHACTNTTLSLSPTLATHFTRMLSLTHTVVPFPRLLFPFVTLCAPPLSLSLDLSVC